MQDQTIEVRSGEELQLEKLSAYLKAHIPGFTTITEVRQFPGGFSNLTYLLRTNLGAWVLRRPPLGAQIKSANDMAREFRVLEKIRRIYGRIPAPIHLCEDPELLGFRFWFDREQTTVQTYADGHIFWKMRWMPVGVMEWLTVEDGIDINLARDPLGLAQAA